MPQSLSNILVHMIFSTKNRQPFLCDKKLRDELHKYLGGVLINLDCPPITIGGVEDHVHVLSGLSRTCEPAKMVKELKRSSSVWMKGKHPGLKEFAWQSGYGMFSIGFSQITATRRYIDGQEKHHRTVSFQEEFLRFLQKYELAYDERYVWD